LSGPLGVNLAQKGYLVAARSPNRLKLALGPWITKVQCVKSAALVQLLPPPCDALGIGLARKQRRVAGKAQAFDGLPPAGIQGNDADIPLALAGAAGAGEGGRSVRLQQG
jgi:hypothetical protein